MADDAWNRLYAFVEKESGFVPGTKPISRDSALIDDLHLDGDEATDFMESFFKKFDVNPGDYNPHRYFYEEGLNLFAFIPLIFSKKARTKSEREPLILGTLEKAIATGKFDSSVK